MALPLIDTHAHLFAEEYDHDREQMIQECHAAGVGAVLLPNLNLASLPRMLSLVDRDPSLFYPMIGLHPTEFGEDYEQELHDLEQELYTSPDRYIAIGEVGLDYYHSIERKAEMRQVLLHQLQWAYDTHKPLSLHARSATADVVQCIREVSPTILTGVFHSFTDSEEELRQILELPGFLVGINGVVTFKNSHLRELLPRCLPLERLVLETDSPYLAPVPKRGRRNTSAYLPYILTCIADAYGMSEKELKTILSENSIRVFGLTHLL